MSRKEKTRRRARRWLSALVVLALCWASALGALAQQPTSGGVQASATGQAEQQDRRELLRTRHGYADRMLGDRAALELWRARALARQRALEPQLEGLREERSVLVGEARALARQVGDEALAAPMRGMLAGQLASAHIERGVVTARRGALDRAREEAVAEARLLAEYLDAMTREDTERNQTARREAAEAEADRQREAQKRQRAEADLEKIKERQRQARTSQLKDLLAQQQELAERVVELTRRRPELEAQLEEANAGFVKRRDELTVSVEQLPEELKLKRRKEEIDPIFARVRQERRQARQVYFEALDELDELEAAERAARRALASAKARLKQAERQAELGETELERARADLARTRVKKEQLELDLAQLRAEHARARLDLLDERLRFFEDEIELLLPRISDPTRKSFYSLTRDENWEDARVGLQLAVHRVTEHLHDRLREALELAGDPFSISLWAWVSGFIIRLLLLMGGLYLVRTRGRKLVRRLTDALLKRRFFHEHPTATIKTGEVIRHVISPLSAFLAITYMLSYVRQVLPELSYAQWIINAIFIFQVTTIVVSVVILPRTVREPERLVQGRFLDEDDDPEGVDVFSLEVSRARKLVRSAKVIIWFWLIVIYVPELIVALMGHSVVWRIADVATTWSFILVIYSVLSTWKEDIASLFQKLAEERLPRAVQFVNENKDRIWGVLVIGVASVYVIGSESIRLGRRYLLDTEWSKRINNFIFRKKIELKQRDRPDDQAGSQLKLAALPRGYRDYFVDEPLDGEVFKVERDAAAAAADGMLKRYVDWKASHRQGSVAISGEAGIGKTTTLHIIAGRLKEICDGTEAEFVCAHVFEKIWSEEAVLEFVAGLFDLEPAPTDRAELLRQVMELHEHVIMLDDCHHLFLRRIGGFEGLELFLELVNLTDGHHFWVLSFDHFAWAYLSRVERRDHYFGEIMALPRWSESEIQDLIWTRNLMTGCSASFTDLVVTHDEGEDYSYEVIKSAKGYFRLLHEFSQGNPRVAITYWLRSLTPSEDEEDTLQVGLFRSPPQRITLGMDDNYWFALTAIAQHGCLNAAEIAQVINGHVGFCEMALNYFEEMDVITLDARRRAQLTPLYMRQVLKHLKDSNYLYD